MDDTKNPSVFISYAWSGDDHLDWVINLASRLKSDGVEVVLDRWKLKAGDDKYAFMERMVTDVSIDFVLVVSDSVYQTKADSKKGGAGTESQILSDELYSRVKETKVIPILKERKENGAECLPVFLRNRMYIDFSNKNTYETSYEELLRYIYRKPALKEPPLGQMPSFLMDEKKPFSQLQNHARGFSHRLETCPQKVDVLLSEFLSSFKSDLKNYEVRISQKEYHEMGRAMVKSIEDYLPSRHCYIEVLSELMSSGLSFNIDIIIRLFEDFPKFYRPQIPTITSWYSDAYDNYHYFARELFLYTIALCLIHEKYDVAADLLYSRYSFKDNYYRNIKDYSALNAFVHVFDEYIKQRDNTNYYTCMGHLMITNVDRIIDKEQLIAADIVCNYVAQLRNLYWTPHLFIYRDDDTPIDLIQRLYSKRHFEKVKTMFDVNTVEELKQKLTDTEKHFGNKRPFMFDRMAPAIFKDINVEELCSSR